MSGPDRNAVATRDKGQDSARPKPGQTRQASPVLNPAAASVLALQRKAGNAAVSQLLMQREPAGAAVAAPPPAAAGWAQRRQLIEGVRARATARSLKTEAVIGLGNTVLTSARLQLEGASAVYGRAYENYEAIISAAKKAAKREEEWIEVGVSIALAIGFATGVGAAAEAVGLVAAEGASMGTILAAKAAEEAVVASATEGSKAVLKHKTGLLEVAGSQMEAGGLKPAVMKLQLWEELVRLHSGLLATVKLAELQSLMASNAEFAIGEIKVQMASGGGVDLDMAALDDLTNLLLGNDAQFADIDSRLDAAITQLQSLKKSLDKAGSPQGREWELERDIWILWMAELPEDEAKVLDIDAIEDHLEAMKIKTSGYSGGGYLGVDTGFYTTKNDCLKLIEAAKPEAAKLRAKYGAVGGGL
jgi:hypothetical protein